MQEWYCTKKIILLDIKLASNNPAEKGSSLNSCFFAVRTLSTPQLTAEREAVAHDI